MTCPDFERWLDGGMREADAAAARSHAAGCARCAAALEAALTIETALFEASAASRALPHRAPEGFASGVMARLGDSGVAPAARIAEGSPQPWWIRLLSDPVAAVSATVALLALGLLLWSPAWAVRFGEAVGVQWLAWVARADAISPNSTLLLAVLAAAAPLTLWLLWQIGRALERAMVLQVTRPEV